MLALQHPVGLSTTLCKDFGREFGDRLCTSLLPASQLVDPAREFTGCPDGGAELSVVRLACTSVIPQRWPRSRQPTLRIQRFVCNQNIFSIQYAQIVSLLSDFKP